MKIFCDLDGTLIDVSTRHYRVYEEVVRELSGNPIDKNKYWILKRNKTKWAEILTLSKLSPDIESEFLGRFIQKIEDPKYLILDSLFPDVINTLEIFSKLGECYLVSLRRNRDNLLQEVKDLGLDRHFTEILTGHSENNGYDVKISLIKDKLDEEEGFIIGDTEADVVTGRELGLRTIAVTSGIRSEELLVALEPDYLIDRISDAPELLL